MHGAIVADADIAREIAPCFKESGAARTDVVTLACTHYPLLLEAFQRLAPWPVEWIDPAPAIARRVDQLLGEKFPQAARRDVASKRLATFTSGRTPEPMLAATLARFALTCVRLDGA
jgi:glutamate racemase